MPADDYKIVIWADTTLIGQHVIYEVSIIIVCEEFDSHDIILHRINGVVRRVSETDYVNSSTY